MTIGKAPKWKEKRARMIIDDCTDRLKNGIDWNRCTNPRMAAETYLSLHDSHRGAFSDLEWEGLEAILIVKAQALRSNNLKREINT